MATWNSIPALHPDIVPVVEVAFARLSGKQQIDPDEQRRRWEPVLQEHLNNVDYVIGRIYGCYGHNSDWEKRLGARLYKLLILGMDDQPQRQHTYISYMNCTEEAETFNARVRLRKDD